MIVSDPVERFLAAAIDEGHFPSAAWVVSDGRRVLSSGALGDAVVGPPRVPATPGTIYDLASLTKPLVTSMLWLKLRRELDLDPRQPARRWLPEFDAVGLAEITVAHLLTHASGLPEWLPLYVTGRTPAEYLKRLRGHGLEARPGSRVRYSCGGYIALGELLVRAGGAPLDRLAEEVIFRPLRLQWTAFNPPSSWLDRVAATEDSCHYERGLVTGRGERYEGFRSGVVRGQVHDTNAFALGGVAGNAGLFSTASETAALAAEFLGEEAGGQGLLDAGSRALAREDLIPDLPEARSYAFRLALRGDTAAGPGLSPRSFGHNGFTGTSVWIDPDARRLHVLLTNRVHPEVRDTTDMVALRRQFHAAARDL